MSESHADSKQLIADALNEHGFLLQQVLRKKLAGHLEDSTHPQEKWQDTWRCIAAEYPVTAADGSQTRIDLLLQSTCAQGTYICLECKRPNPKFKKWIFFDRESGVAGMPDWQMIIEVLNINRQPPTPYDIQRTLRRTSTISQFPIFSYYLEAAVKRDRSNSSTEAIETAFTQLMKAHSGLMAKLNGTGDVGLFRSIPVLVTTAELMEARFDPGAISIESGMIDPNGLCLAPLDYCAVNYRASDSLALPTLASQDRGIGPSDIMNAQTRTIFIVHTTAIHRFLNLAQASLLDS